MATGAEVTASGGSAWDVVLGAARDSLSTWIDLSKQKHSAGIAERIYRSTAEQDRLTRMVELRNQDSTMPVDVRVAPGQPLTVTIPPTVKYIGLGLVTAGLVFLGYKALR